MIKIYNELRAHEGYHMSELQLELILFLSILAGIAFYKMCEALALLSKELDRMNKVVRINDKVCERKMINKC